MTQALELAVKGMPDRIRQQMDATRHYLVQNNIDPHFADILLSHYGDFARELDEALTALRSLPQEEVSGWKPALQVLAEDLDERPEPIAQEVAHHLRTLLRSAPTQPPPSNPYEELVEAAKEYQEALKNEYNLEGLIGIDRAQVALCEAAENLQTKDGE